VLRELLALSSIFLALRGIVAANAGRISISIELCRTAVMNSENELGNLP
jgi:hypothetical protein